jgi:hypothetical protein
MGSKVTLGEELLFPNEYLSAFDLAGKDLTLTIASISRQELRLNNGGKKVKPVCTFKDHVKKFVANVTNSNSIAFMYGTKAESWVGKQVTFFPTTTPGPGGNIVDCIRVREKVPQTVSLPEDHGPALLEWQKWLESDPALADFNARMPDLGKLKGSLKKVVYGACVAYTLNEDGTPRWLLDRTTKPPTWVPAPVAEPGPESAFDVDAPTGESL